MNTQAKKPNAWIEQIFGAEQAQNGGIVRRSIESVLQNSSEAELVEAVRFRGFKLIRTGGQFVILCHHGYVEIV